MKKKYAQILEDNSVNLIVIKEEDFEAFKEASDMTIIDISDRNPRPQQGWIYDEEKDEFTNPNPEPEPPVEKPEEEIDADVLSQSEINKLILKKLGYKVKEAK